MIERDKTAASWTIGMTHNCSEPNVGIKSCPNNSQKSPNILATFVRKLIKKIFKNRQSGHTGHNHNGKRHLWNNSYNSIAFLARLLLTFEAGMLLHVNFLKDECSNSGQPQILGNCGFHVSY